MSSSPAVTIQSDVLELHLFLLQKEFKTFRDQTDKILSDMTSLSDKVDKFFLDTNRRISFLEREISNIRGHVVVYETVSIVAATQSSDKDKTINPLTRISI